MKLKGVKSLSEPTTGEIQNLPDFPCAAVKLSVSTKIDNGRDDPLAGAADNFYESEAYEVYWGFFGAPVHQIFPGTTTEYIYVENLSDLSVRCNKKNAGGTFVNISVFKEVQ